MNINEINDLNELISTIQGLESKLNYNFKDKQVLLKALSHSSFSNELKSKSIKAECNERLEFFGDSILSLTVSEYLYTNYPDLPEGELSKVRAGTVCERALSKFAREIELGKYMLLGHGEEITNGRERSSILADAFEALLAAMYIDGGIEPVKAFVLPFAINEIQQILVRGNTKDYKSMLQQFVQQEHGDVLEYKLVKESGPAHDRVFETEAYLNNNVIGKGIGKSKRESEQNAAKEALLLFGQA
ncbi:MAG: ribonuclease III [Ruminococcaceae bacterium]|nr:ribonuclease III [Oscillospiraceae bacterium]